MRKSIYLTSLLWALGSPTTGAETLSVRGVVTDVKVARGQAHVERELTISGEIGEVSVIVTDLPGALVRDSVTVDATDDLLPVSIRVAVGPDAQPAQSAVALTEEARTLDSEFFALSNAIDAARKQLAYLDGLEDMAIATTQEFRGDQHFDATQITDLTLFTFEKRRALLAHRNRLENEQAELNRRRAQIEASLASAEASLPAKRYQALLRLRKLSSGTKTVRLSYLVNDITWNPEYILDWRGPSGEVHMQRYAALSRGSADEWRSVQMSLLTHTHGRGLAE